MYVRTREDVAEARVLRAQMNYYHQSDTGWCVSINGTVWTLVGDYGDPRRTARVIAFAPDRLLLEIRRDTFDGVENGPDDLFPELVEVSNLAYARMEWTARRHGRSATDRQGW